MSYDIVFKTIVVEKDNKIYHFSRTGCNNDDYGRKDDEFAVKVYDNKEQALKDIGRFKGSFEGYLKLNSKFVDYDYYYRYLKKKIDKPINYESFKDNYYSYFSQLENITCKNNNCSYTPKEYWKILGALHNQYGKLTIKYNFKELQFDELKSGLDSVRIHIRKRKHYK